MQFQLFCATSQNGMIPIIKQQSIFSDSFEVLDVYVWYWMVMLVKEYYNGMRM
jgi:hypothetical protein